MTRSATPYAERGRPARSFVGVDPETPMPGFYRHRLRAGGVYVAVEIWFGAPHDPVTGEELDRSPRYQARVNGEYVELDTVWPACAGAPIDAAEAEHLMNLQRWGAANGHAALADPRQKPNLLTMPLPF